MAMSHTYWTEYLAKSRNGHDRPINGSTVRRVMRGKNGSIILRLHATDVVTLHVDGTETINTGGWHTVATKAFIAEHSRARVWSDDSQLYVRITKPTCTPPRVSKCRRCKNGQQSQACFGPEWCHAAHGYVCEHGETSSHRRTECRHGRTAAHALPSVDCWQCHGAGRYDYGSTPVHYKWDGGPLAINCQGYPVGSVMPEIETSYSDSSRLLSSALPALATIVKCPHCAIDTYTLEAAVIHLNDTATWTRERVADWLDTLDIDLSFPVPDYIPAHVA